MLRVCLDDVEILSFLCDAAEDFARGEIPDNVSRCLMLATMTALERRDGGVRELQPVHRTADWSRRCGPVSSASKWNRLALLSNSRCPREEGPIA